MASEHVQKAGPESAGQGEATNLRFSATFEETKGRILPTVWIGYRIRGIQA